MLQVDTNNVRVNVLSKHWDLFDLPKNFVVKEAS